MDALSYESKRQDIVIENTHAFCIVNYEPIKQGHVMVLPKRYVDRLEDMTPDELADCNALIAQLAERIAREFKEDPIIVMNRGVHSTQPHLHWHVLPSKGGLRELLHAFEQVPFRKRVSAQELATMRDRLQ